MSYLDQKTELIHRQDPWRNVDHIEWATLTYNRRIHNEMGKIPPAEMEANHYRQIDTAELVSSQTTESLYETPVDSVRSGGP